jgi:hypothetical protein
MAKRKRNRPGTAGAGRESGAAAKGRMAPEQLPRVAPAEPGGPNRAARKEAARQQREAIQRRMARRRYYRVIGAVLAVLLVAGAITAYQLTRPSPTAVAGCGPVQKTQAVRPAPASGLGDRSHVPTTSRPKLSTYPTHPPASGPHDQVPLPAGVYENPPDVYRTIHSLEHGAVIVWYRPTLTSGDIEKIKSFYRNTAANDHVIVAPYSYPTEGPAGLLPNGKDMVMVAWHRYEACDQANLGVVKDFVKLYRTPTGVTSPPGYKGVAPEAGRAIG